MATYTNRSATTRALRLITAALILGALLLMIGTPQPAYADPINDAFQGCGVLTFDSDAQGFRTASTTENRTVNSGPHAAPFQQGSGNAIAYFRWEGTGGNPSGHLRADDMDGEYQEVWTPVLTDPVFSGIVGQQIQFDYKNDTGYSQYRLYVAIVGINGNQYYYYFNSQLGAVGAWSRVKVPMVASEWHTGFEASENPNTPPDSPAPSAANFAAVLGSLDRFAISVEGVSGTDTSRFDNFGRACDYGDLPESGTSFVTTGANAARHNISDEVRLGALIDSEPDGQPGSEANGDDLNNTDDEDGVASFPPLSGATTSYAVTLSARNTSGAPATLWGWVDFNNDGQFSPAEAASTSVANGANPANVTLTWSPVSVTVPVGAKAYARFRITTDSLSDNGATPQDERAQGRAGDGEAEDYAVTVIGDYGDAPTSYGNPSHSPQGPYMGATQPDSESGSQHTANAQGDDLAGVDDEDGASSFPPLNTTSTSYSVSVLANNPSGTAATLYGWVDFDDNGRFSAGEAATAAVPAGTVNGAITLNWSGITVDPAAVGTAYARFRITTAALADDPGTGQRDERAESAASNGEVEDYRIRTLDFGDAPNDLSSIDASLTNAYRTTLARNGPRHIVDIAIRLGALIDGEADGQPNLAADGDDTNTVDDEDGVAFNPALGISTANVVLSGAQNTLAVTASANGYLSAWIDYNQNGAFTDAGEQLFNDQAVTPGVNTLTFTTPNTAPHGATYMRFRYSTQTGQANILTGQAPDGEVEDYRVEVTLPSPTTCDADLLNGSFETPGSGLHLAATVPGWGFRAANPASGTGFDQRHTIEIWTNGQEGVPSYEGNQFAEINGYVAGALYQEMLTTPGQTMLWQFAHRGRQGTDVMALKIGPPGATVQVTQATDGNTAWRVYTGSYTVPAGQTITRFEFAAVSSAGGNPSIGNFIDAVHFSLPCDFGDAPNTFGTTKSANGPNHLISGQLRLGALSDAEGSGFPGANADGDDLNNTDDEDSLTTPLPLLSIFDTSYSLTGIPVLNNTGSPAYLYGWVDFNRNGAFDASERVSTTVPSNAAAQTVSLNWTGRSGTVSGQSYVRLRLSPQAGLAATGPGGAGEVEDYPLTIITGGTVVVTKNTVGADGSFAFTSTMPGAGSFSLATGSNTASRTFNGVTPGTYTISETVPAGWVLTGATCSNGTPNSFTVTAGATVTCTFTNTRVGAITVVKSTVGGAGSFSFTSQTLTPAAFALTTVAGAAQRNFANLTPGTYDVSETAQFGWDLTSATCSDGSNPASIDLAAGENVTCTFTNTKRGSITVVKQAVGGDDTFEFLSSFGVFNLTTVGGTAQRSIAGLTPGTYDVSETVPAGWELTSATCSDGSNPNSINLTAGEDVTCTFTNTKLDTIVVYKVAAGGDATFDFTSDIPGASNFSITTANGEGIKFFNNVPPGTYAISEIVPAGWTLADVVCSNGDDPASITLAAGETVACTFGNEKNDTIVVVKRTVGGDGSFSFTSNIPGASSFTLTTTNNFARTSFTVPPDATYNISESVPAGWDLTSAVCSNGNTPDNIYVGAGETVGCVFTNTKQGTITIVKDAVPADGRDFDFTLANDSFAEVFTLDDADPDDGDSYTDSKSFTLPSGDYNVTEVLPDGWALDGIQCQHGPDSFVGINYGENRAYITLAAGDDVVCAFANEKLGSITVVKDADPADDTPFDFTITGGIDDTFTLSDPSATSTTFSALASGDYQVTELLPAGWHLDGIQCQHGPDSFVGIDYGANRAYITLAAGDDVVCTFTNTNQGTITIVKDAMPADGRDFDFTLTDGMFFAEDFTLDDADPDDGDTYTDSKSFTLPSGDYNVTEVLPDGWHLDGIQCQHSSNSFVGIDYGANRAYITLAAGDDVVCTFTNTNQSLGITLASFDAQAQAGHVLVTWQTVSEMDNAGFNLYRTGTADPPTAADLLAYVPSQGPGSTQGYAYSYPDYAVTAGQTYWYWLEDVDFSGGATLHGPVSVVFSAPTAVTLSGLEAAADRPTPMVWPWLATAALAAGLAAWQRRRSSAA